MLPAGLLSSKCCEYRVISTFLMVVLLAFIPPAIAVQMIIEIPENAKHFLDTGFPSALRWSGKPEEPLDLEGLPDNWYQASEVREANEQRLMVGFSPLLPLYMRFNDIDALQFDNDKLKEGFCFGSEGGWEAEPGVFLIRVDQAENNQSLPVVLRMTSEAEHIYRPRGTLSVLPEGCLLESNAHYALVVTQKAVLPQSKGQARQAPLLSDLLSDGIQTRYDTAQNIEPYREGYQLLRRWMEHHHYPVSDILGAICWKTGPATTFLESFFEQFEVHYQDADKLELTFSEENSTAEYDVYQGEMPCLQYQLIGWPSGFLFYRTGYTWQPQEQWYQAFGERFIPVTLTIPANHAGPLNLVQYHHGTGGGSDEPFIRGRRNNSGKNQENTLASNVVKSKAGILCAGTFMAREHEARLGIGDPALWVMHYFNRLISSFSDFTLELNYAYYNYPYLPTMACNMRQSLIERRLLDRKIKRKQILLIKGNKARPLDVSKHILMGHSFGAMTAAIFAACYSSAYDGIIFSGAGNFGVGLPVAFLSAIHGVNYFSGKWNFGVSPHHLVADLTHPVWMLGELMLSHLSPVTSFSSRRPDIPTLIISGIEDNQVPDFMQAPFIAACGRDILSTDAFTKTDSDALSGLGGDSAEYWIKERLKTNKTVFVRFHKDRFSRDGRPVNSHSALFQYDVAGQLCRGFVHSVIADDK